ncbi:hypothetical protein [Chenggangzhangella methanolivorans]|uniref:Lipoprotein n=1 Tax=Chenggangzhangella methanolivorans TaxID=1437009 RepID=A0A9E6RBD9_9HYPH|nr:hypothetical protein [Chenggangzhangella methanolivorans]QZO01649.1 hypothetical protein K6K41_09755 [Chenggangzhangella methanolivorans]
MRRVTPILARLRRAALVPLACLALAACGTVSPDDPNRAAANPDAGTKFLLGTSNPTPLQTSADDIKRSCPPIEILEGASAHRVIEPAGSTDAFDVRYQASIAETARECSTLGVEAAIRIGVQGRVVLGPKGAPGTYRVPLRIAVVDEGSRPVYSQLHLVDVTVPAGATMADFTKIDDAISIPIPANRFAGWRIVVGYDAQAPVAAKTTRRR